MKDKIITVILLLIIISIIVLLGIFGYTIYTEIINKDLSSINFEGYADLLGISSGNNNEEAIDTSVDIFNGIESDSSAKPIVTNSNKYKNLYEQLDDEGKKIYDELYDNRENLKTGTYEIKFGNEFQNILSKDGGESELKKDYQSAIEALIYENPEIFYLDVTKMFINIEKITKMSGTKYNVYINSGTQSNYLSSGYTGKDNINNQQIQIEKVRDYILANVNGKSDYEKIKLIHDYLRDTIEYDSTLSKDNIYDIYGALVSRECVCEGYARAFQYLMNESGIANVIVIGTGTNSSGNTENHAWNYVKLDDNWYAVDVTWDDPVLIGNGVLPEESKYKYFLKGSKTMNVNHVPSGQFTDAGQLFTYPTLSENDY